MQGQTSEIRRLLVEEGLRAAQVAEKLSISTRRVFEYADRHDLPTNPMIRTGGGVEKKICRALVATGMDVQAVASLFRQAPINVQRLMERIQGEEQVHNPCGQQGEEAAAVPVEPRNDGPEQSENITQD